MTIMIDKQVMLYGEFTLQGQGSLQTQTYFR